MRWTIRDKVGLENENTKLDIKKLENLFKKIKCILHFQLIIYVKILNFEVLIGLQ